MTDPVTQGKKNRASGITFELRVRKDLEDKGWTVDKWSNNVEYPSVTKSEDSGVTDAVVEMIKQVSGKIIPAKHKFRGKGIPMAIGTGFPDFIAFKIIYETEDYEVIGVESKVNGYLTKEEKQKCQWYLDNEIFSKIYIAKKTKVKNKVVIVYEDFNKKYP